MARLTYNTDWSRDNLRQGDVLQRTSAINSLLEQVHSHYFGNESYRYFIVLTQSCDLVRRNGGDCSARYITLAAVRPLDLAVDRQAALISSNLAIEEVLKMSVGTESHKARLRQFVGHLINNNETNCFYLAQDLELCFPEDCCAFLKLSIAVKAKQHYPAMLEAKCLELKESFQHKLGYLVGNSYARVGTEDWVPGLGTEAQFNQRISEIVDRVQNVIFLSKENFNFVEKNLPKVDQQDESDGNVILKQLLEKMKKEKQSSSTLLK